MNNGIQEELRMIRELGLWPTIFIKVEAHRLLLLRLVVSIGVLLFIVGVSKVFTLSNLLYGAILTAVPFGLAFFFIVQSRLYLTPILILIAAAYIPFSLPTGTGSRLVISLIFTIGFLFLWWFRKAVIEKDFRLVPSYVNVPVFGFVAATLLSFAWSTVFRDPLLFVPNSFIFVQSASAVIMIVSPLTLLLVANLVHEVKYLKALAWIMVSVGVLGFIGNYLGGRLPVNTNGLASMWIIGLTSSLALFDKKLTNFARGLLAFLALLWVYWGFVVNLSWVAGWLPGFITGFVIVFLRSKKLLALGMVVIALYVLTNTSILERWFGEETLTSGDTRVMAWEMNWRFTSQHLLFGLGPAGYAIYYMTYYPLEAMATHSNYIDLISETGILGTVFYLAIFGVLVWRGWVVYQRVKGRFDFLEALAAAALGGTAACIVIMGFGDWLLPFAYTQTIAGFSYTVYSWLFMGTIPAMDIITADETLMSGETG